MQPAKAHSSHEFTKSRICSILAEKKICQILPASPRPTKFSKFSLRLEEFGKFSVRLKEFSFRLRFLLEEARSIYSEFHLIWTQELGYFELDLGLLRSQMASM